MSRLQQLARIVQEANTGLVTAKEVKSLIDTIVGAVKDSRAALEQKVASNKAEMDKEVSKAITKATTDLTAQEKRLTALCDNLDQKHTTSLASAIKQIKQEVKSLRDSIPEEADLSELYQEIEEIEKWQESITELFTAENVRNMLELLEGDERLDVSAIKGLDELIKRVGKGQGWLKGSASVPSPMHVPTFEQFTMNGVATSVTLNHAVGAAGHAIFNVTYQGQVLLRDTQYTVNGNQITLVGFTPLNNRIISVTYMP